MIPKPYATNEILVDNFFVSMYSILKWLLSVESREYYGYFSSSIVLRQRIQDIPITHKKQ